MSDTIRLVQNDTLPKLYVALTDQSTGLPVDISTATQVKMDFRAMGATVLTATLIGTLITGLVNPDGSITSAGYTVPGSGGRFTISWGATTLAAIGPYEGSVTVTFPGPASQTAYETLRFFVRAVI